MNAAEHKALAEELLRSTARHPEASDSLVLAQLATAHATLATIPDRVEKRVEPVVSMSALAPWSYADPTITRVEGGPAVLTWLDSDPDQCVITKDLFIELAQHAHPGLIVQTTLPDTRPVVDTSVNPVISETPAPDASVNSNRPKVGDELTEEPDPSVVLKCIDRDGDKWGPRNEFGLWTLNGSGPEGRAFAGILAEYAPLRVAEVAE